MPQKIKRDREPLLAPNGSGLQSTFYTGLLFGPNGCGKTTFAEQLSMYYARGTRVDGKVWAIDPNGAWVGVEGVKSIWNGDDGVDEMLADSLRWGPGLINFDDADSYIRHSTMIQLNYLTRNRHYQKDMMIIARRPQGIPKDAIASARFVALFAGSTLEPYAHDYFRSCFGDEIVEAVPTKEFHYLLIVRRGGTLTHEVRRTKPRKLKMRSDKT